MHYLGFPGSSIHECAQVESEGYRIRHSGQGFGGWNRNQSRAKSVHCLTDWGSRNVGRVESNFFSNKNILSRTQCGVRAVSIIRYTVEDKLIKSRGRFAMVGLRFGGLRSKSQEIYT